jgi:NAD(P)-dependent dehydrogenase (short-subunit alcohol dehydrogenase family)
MHGDSRIAEKEDREDQHMTQGNDLTGKVAIVTGAAGEIGTVTSALLAQRGASIVAVDRPGAAFEGLQAAMPQGARLHTVFADVTVEAEVAGYVAQALSTFGRVDIFFNNAGVEGLVRPIPDYPLEAFEKVMAVNVIGVFLGMKHVIPAMLASGGGAIINTSSVAGVSGSPGLSAYNASKHAVIGLTRAAAAEWAAHGIRVNSVNPGPIESRMMRSIEGGASPDNPGAVHEQFAATIPAHRYGTPDEVARMVAFLASDDAAYLNGGVYMVDGGLTAT